MKKMGVFVAVVLVVCLSSAYGQSGGETIEKPENTPEYMAVVDDLEHELAKKAAPPAPLKSRKIAEKVAPPAPLKSLKIAGSNKQARLPVLPVKPAPVKFVPNQPPPSCREVCCGCGASRSYCPSLPATYALNLSHGTVMDVDPYISTIISPAGGVAPYPCNKQAVVKLTFSALRRQAKIDLDYGPDVSGWSFTICDTYGCNGYGGGLFTSPRCVAEVEGLNSGINVYSNVLPLHKESTQNGWLTMAQIPKFVKPNRKLTLYVSDERIDMDNGYSCRMISSRYLYCLRGQPQSSFTGPPEYDVWMSFNRVLQCYAPNSCMSTPSRFGKGVCHARVAWVPC